MAGNALALTDRDRTLLAEVQRYGVLTREHVLRLRLFASKTRANDRLRRLTTAGYLRVRPQPLPAGGPRHVYLPGGALAASGSVRRREREASDLFLAHQLGIVDVRVAFAEATRISLWLSDTDLKSSGLGLVPDAYVEYLHQDRTYCAFLEYDRGTETLGRLEQKVRAYLRLAFSGTFERLFARKFFRALFVVDTPARCSTVSAAVGRITTKVIRLATAQDVMTHGPLAPIWRHPGVDSPSSLIDS